ncbi:hypothetical protein MTX26_35505 (plasmid) [Bradyrhizobium sp. ISRA443]|uniref:hypothetical protein n=1 Tax=unclassified Bradyrhizobium TaxID=2631580 RepID=UPI00247AE5AD|nr:MULTISPECIES: hypothetical protein [unclassified Bradyrhizobium]WGR90734.1 hypothetical protein MTX20_01370 [Bradyrhizobium sp. ISRA435]WGS03133.1 hypothetical protein MTX23_35115 [Bradyrhizobium sp. ISRA436]WGS10073.1 hypothetical protein MTX18_35505 [Bradyrhizobium sp. ISRA437]WGS16958.1 hypothetical protein MTX26_35505 [Bradyrhizobium sp. ISRA443]
MDSAWCAFEKACQGTADAVQAHWQRFRPNAQLADKELVERRFITGGERYVFRFSCVK